MNYFYILFAGLLCGIFFYALSVHYINGSSEDDKNKALSGFLKCTECGRKINFIYLIPVIGYFIIKGKCSYCGHKLTKAFPIIEIFFGILALVIYLKYGLNLYSLIIFFIICVAISVSIVDIKILSIPNSLIIFFIVLSIYPVIYNNSLKDNLYGFLLMSAFFLIILLIFPGSFGGGDLKFASSIGILLGFELSIVALETALITGSITGAVYAIKSRKGFKIKFPFAPFLAAGLLVSLLYGRDILYIYFRLVY